MQRSVSSRIIAFIGFVLTACSPGLAQTQQELIAVNDHPFVSPLFTDNMVLQRDRNDPIWGWITPAATVTVTVDGKSATAVAGSDGKWMARLSSHRAGGPYTVTITAGPPPLASKMLINVMYGDVWVCSGQSNMQFGLGLATNGMQEVAAADHPLMRLFAVPLTPSVVPRPTANGPWRVCNPATVGHGGWQDFSAVAYFFGRELQQNLNIPIGLIETSWGGTPAEAWTSAEALKAMPDFARVDQTVAQAEDKLTHNPSFGMQYVPTTLYNAMISPLIPFGIKGAIWYQGESNAGRAAQYKRLLPLMIQDWRSRWSEGDFPFLIVQLANFGASKPEPADDRWAELREAQAITSQTIPNTGLAVAIDIGDPGDIHPKNKQEVGRRLSLIALAKVYGKRVECSGPQFSGLKIEGSTIRLRFTHARGGLVAQGGPLTGFAIAGDDKHFVWADARIDGETVLVSSPRVAHPSAVRYAWAANPTCNLYNKSGLPAVPFRTGP